MYIAINISHTDSKGVSRASVKGWLIQGVIFNLVTYSKNWNQSVTKYQISWKVEYINFVNFFEDESKCENIIRD